MVGASLPRAQQRLQRRVGGHGVERIGIEHQARGLFQQPGQMGLDRLPAAAAADQCGVRQVECVRAAQHQFGPGGQRAHAFIQRRQQHAPGTAVQGRERRQNGRARHAHAARGQAFAADDGHVAKTALVAGVHARCGRRSAAEYGAGRLPGRIDAQVLEPDLAGRVASLRGEQPGVQGEQRQGVAGSDGGLCACQARGPLSAVRQQARGHVHAQHGRLAGAQVAEPLQQARIAGVSVGRGPQADAQQGVDAQIPRLEAGGRLGEEHACVARVLTGVPCVGGQLVRAREQ